MKLWLNHLLACPDDKSFPLSISILQWDPEGINAFGLISAYQNKGLLNYSDPNKPEVIQTDSDKTHELNAKYTTDMNYQNLISIFIEDEVLKFKDLNIVKPCDIKTYLKSYIELLDEFGYVEDKSASEEYKKALNIVREIVIDKIKNFHDSLNPAEFKVDENLSEKKVVTKALSTLSGIFQELLYLNYVLYLLEIKEGILKCPKCGRLFPIIETIPRLLPKSMARDDIDKAFENRWNLKLD